MTDESDDTRFGPLLARLRGVVSRSSLAKAIGCSGPFLVDIERGRRSPLRPDMIARCCEVLRLSPDEAEALRAAAARERASNGMIRLAVTDASAEAAAELVRVWSQITTPEQFGRLRDTLRGFHRELGLAAGPREPL